MFLKCMTQHNPTDCGTKIPQDPADMEDAWNLIKFFVVKMEFSDRNAYI